MKLRSLSAIRLSLPLAAALAALLGTVPAQADTYTYTVPDAFTTGDENWSTDTKWDVVPVSDPTTSLIFTLQATGNSQTQTTGAINNIVTGNPNNAFQLNTLTFNSNPSAGSGSLIVALNISGNPLDFVNDGATTPVINLNGNRSAGQPVNFNVANNVSLAADTLFTGNGTATFNFSGQLSGSAFTKSGTSTLTLSGANTYSGNATLSAGGLILANNSALSGGALNVTGDSRIGFTNGVNISNAINRGSSTVTYFYAGTTAGTATYSGALTGSGTINIANSGSGNNTTILDFTNAGGFTGNVVGAAGNANGADYFRFSAIGDGGNFTFNKAGNRGGVIYNGTSAIEFDTRQIALGTSFGGGGTYGVNGNGVVQNAFLNDAANAAHTVTFNADMAMTSITSSSVFYFDGANTGNNTFAGDIADPTGAQVLGIGKQGAGKWILSGNNSYEGNTFILNGTLSVNTMANAGNNQALGRGSLIYFSNSSTTTSTLEFTGSTDSSTDKQVVIGSSNNNHNGGAAIVNNGDGTLSFTNTTFNSLPGTVTTVDRTLTLGGSNTDANEIEGVIQDNVAGAAQVLLTKTGSGRWVLSGNNTYTGTTAIQGGVLVANHANAIAGGLAFGGTGAAITLTGNGVLGLGAGDFTRLPSGASVTAGRIAFLDNGGFAAYGADRVVNFGGSSGIVAIGSTTTANIGSLNGKTLILGASTATHKVTVTNTLDFGNGSRTIQVNNGAAAVDAEISGILQPQSGGTAGLNKTGDGTLLLSSNANTLNGQTNVTAGKLIVNGNISTSVLTVVNTGATLGGSGTVGNLTIDSGGFFSPGNSPGIITVDGDYIQNGQLDIEIEGLTAGNGGGFHDRVDVDGTVTLNGALNIESFIGFTPVNGDLIFILLNDDSDSITGTFTGLAQGAVVGTYLGFDWQISYTGDSIGNTFTGGNDVVLMAVPEPRAALLGSIGLLMLFRRRR